MAVVLAASATESVPSAVDDRGPSATIPGPPESSVQRRHHVMGTWLDVTVWADTRERAMASAEAAVEAVEVADRRLSTWRYDSELAAVNRSDPDRGLQVSSRLARDLFDATEWGRRTMGTFSPTMGSLVTAWDLRGSGRIPGHLELDDALATSRQRDLHLRDRHVRLGRVGLRIEEGGFGKGAALRDALAAARAKGAMCVVLDFGGQVAVRGECAAVVVGVADPRDRQARTATVHIEAGSAATSGLSERGVTVDGVRYGHIVDPRDGRPVVNWGSVTVVADDPFVADCVATALFVMGPDDGPTWAARQPGIDALFIESSDGETRFRATIGLRRRLTLLPHSEVVWISEIGVSHHGPLGLAGEIH